jgi:hypothetical protein
MCMDAQNYRHAFKPMVGLNCETTWFFGNFASNSSFSLPPVRVVLMIV